VDKPRPRLRSTLARAAGYLAAVAGLVWVLHDVAWARLLKHVTGLDWRWAALGVLADVASYVSQGFRWRLLLGPVGDLSVVRATEAVYAGLFVNEVAPFHLGEVARAYPVSRWLAAPLVSIVPSMALERLFDGIWLAAGIGLTAIWVPLPRDLIEAGDIFGLTIIGLTALTLYLIVRKARAPRPEDPARPRSAAARWVAANLRQLAAGLRMIGLTRNSAAAFLASFLVVAFQAFSFWFVMIAYGLRLSFWIGGAVFLIVRFGTVIPGAPGNLGLYQVFCVLGLALFGVDKTAAAGFSIVVFVLLSVPLWGLGILALGRTGMSMAAMRAKIKPRSA
jgi:uncharacterized protein (TIRG00374 family)